MRTINGRKYDEFLDGFMGGAYGVSRNGKIGVDKSGQIFAGQGVSETDKKLVEYKVKEETDPDNRDLYRSSAAKLRKEDPAHTVSERAPLSEYKILDNPAKELSSPRKYSSQATSASGLGLSMLKETTTSIPREMRKNAPPKPTVPSTAQEKTNKPTAFFREAPAWTKPAEETDYRTVNSAREYARGIIDKQFGGIYRDAVGLIQTPKRRSEVYELEQDYKNKKQQIHNLASIAHGLAKTAEYYLGYQGMKAALPYATTLDHAALTAIESQFPSVPSVSEFLKPEKISENSKSVKNRKQILEKVQDSEYQYLVKDKEARNVFLKRLGDEYEKAKEQGTYGFSSEEEDNIFRDAVMQELMRIIYLNHNYDNEVENLNELIENAGNK